MAVRKVNKAAMKRELERIRAEKAAGASPLPAEFVNWLRADYEPRAEGLQPIAHLLKPFIEEVLAASSMRTPEALRKITTHLAHFGKWAHDRGLPLETTTVVRRHTDEYCRTGMPNNNHRKDRRSRLRWLADQVNPGQAPAKSESMPRPALKPPYTDDQMVTIRRIVPRQTTPAMVRSLSICVGLGAGAGIDSLELKLLTRAHCTDLGTLGIKIDIPGKNARTVWVLAEYEAMVRTGLEGLEPDQPLIGRVQERTNVAARIYTHAKLYGNVPHLEQSRMRTTWLATLMSRPVPLAVLMRAAGLRSTRTLFDLLPHIPALPDATRNSESAQSSVAAKDAVKDAAA